MEINRCLKCMTNLAHGESVCPKCGTRVGEIEKQAISLAPETILHGKYYVGAVLGQGGFGITYIGFDMLLEIPVAIKEYFPSSIASRSGNTIQWHNSADKRREGFDSFLKEARKMARLKSVPSVVGVQDVFLENDTAYIVMEYVEGETLAGRLKRCGIMKSDECVALLRPIMEDMSRVHESGIVHRDIKPDNIMIRPDGKAVLLDLGAAKELTAAQMQEGKSLSSNLVVSQGFSPYEQYTTNAKIGPWTDVYAMCATIYYCVTGKVLPTAMDRMGNTVDTVFPQELGAGLTAVLKKGLAVRKDGRIQNMQELIDALDKVPIKRPAPPPPPPPPPFPTKKILLIASALVITAIAAFAFGRKESVPTAEPASEPVVIITAPPVAEPAPSSTVTLADVSTDTGAVLLSPRIIGHPEDSVIEEGMTVCLTVDAVDDNASGTYLKYQWYKTDKPSNTSGMAIADAQSANYYPEALPVTAYYYAGVWATDGNNTSKVVFSAPAEVIYTAPTPVATASAKQSGLSYDEKISEVTSVLDNYESKLKSKRTKKSLSSGAVASVVNGEIYQIDNYFSDLGGNGSEEYMYTVSYYYSNGIPIAANIYRNLNAKASKKANAYRVYYYDGEIIMYRDKDNIKNYDKPGLLSNVYDEALLMYSNAKSELY